MKLINERKKKVPLQETRGRGLLALVLLPSPVSSTPTCSQPSTPGCLPYPVLPAICCSSRFIGLCCHPCNPCHRSSGPSLVLIVLVVVVLIVLAVLIVRVTLVVLAILVIHRPPASSVGS